jgi:hypothetical protein
VYDISGREVAQAASREFPAGASEVNFDARGLPSGVYFYQIRTVINGINQIHGMVLR